MRSGTVAAVVLGLCWLTKAIPTGHSPQISRVEAQTPEGLFHSSSTSLDVQNHRLSQPSNAHSPLLPRTDETLLPVGATTSESQILPTATQEIYGGLFVFNVASNVDLLEVFVATYDPDSETWVQGYTVQCDAGQKTAKLRVYAPSFQITPVRFVTIMARRQATMLLSLRKEPMVLRGDEVEVRGKETRSMWWGLLTQTFPDLSKDSKPIVLRPNMPPRFAPIPAQPVLPVGFVGPGSNTPLVQGGDSGSASPPEPRGQGQDSRVDPDTPSSQEGLSAPLVGNAFGGQER